MSSLLILFNSYKIRIRIFIVITEYIDAVNSVIAFK